ncbi:killer cell lectin-like receptor subfamily B member 1C [Microcaecilia unicolor]|uniref:Killer cell lectin-like receptor subfamily B member 1C n=1 Tax=Microcaecilia unicolor TaxID=1415580 RepID=A0A6P7XAR3_9AMPH|nr:killer cell lectin-like receptor subfamily B member 1C [Microcaecilia unicolor]
MAETVTYSDTRFGKRKKLKPSQTRSPGKSLQEDRQVTYAAVRVQEVSEEKVNLESAKTETRQKAQQCTSFWFCAAVFLLILDLLLLTLSITLGVLYHKCQKDTVALTQARSGLQDTLEKLQKWKILRERNEYCPEDWRPWKGKCYFVSKEASNWSSSASDCSSRGSHVARLKNPKDLESIYISSPDYYWVALSMTEMDWIWPNGTKSRNPKADSSSVCVAVALNAMYPADCEEQLRWICEKSAVVLQLEQDYNLTVISVDGIKYTEFTKERV